MAGPPASDQPSAAAIPSSAIDISVPKRAAAKLIADCIPSSPAGANCNTACVTGPAMQAIPKPSRISAGITTQTRPSARNKAGITLSAVRSGPSRSIRCMWLPAAKAVRRPDVSITIRLIGNSRKPVMIGP